MRWKHCQPGTILWKKRFAFIPKKVQHVTIWLESYYVCVIYDKHPWDDTTTKYTCLYLNDAEAVKEYLLSLSPLAKALRE